MRLTTTLAAIALLALGVCLACGPSESPAPAAATPVAAHKSGMSGWLKVGEIW